MWKSSDQLESASYMELMSAPPADALHLDYHSYLPVSVGILPESHGPKQVSLPESETRLTLVCGAFLFSLLSFLQ